MTAAIFAAVKQKAEGIAGGQCWRVAVHNPPLLAKIDAGVKLALGDSGSGIVKIPRLRTLRHLSKW
jgi:hypothetical protein